jgi:hypothetical protein
MPGGKIRISIISSKMSNSAIAALFVALHMVESGTKLT